MKRKTMKFFYHPSFEEHKTGEMCPENFERIEKALRYLEENHEKIEPPNGEEYLSLVHSDRYINSIREESGSKEIYQPVPEAYVSEKTYKSACYAAGAAVEAGELSLQDKSSFALVRPPGHHAPFGGFCIFNNIAVAAENLLKKNNSVLILDWDAHHGNGTQRFFKGRENIIYFSVHQSPFYPGTGTRSKDNCYNHTLSAGEGDEEFIEIIEEYLEPLLKKFNPDVVGVSAGFDSMKGDPLTGLELTKDSYGTACEVIKEYSPFFVLEGGYNPDNVLEGVREVAEHFT